VNTECCYVIINQLIGIYIDILYNKFLDTALPFISMAKSEASGSSFHRPSNTDMMGQYKKKVRVLV